MSISKIDEKQFWINEYGLLLFRNKFNKDLILKRPYHWCEDNYLVIDEGKQNLIVQTPKLEEIDFDDWTPISKEEYEEKKHFRELQKNYKYLIHDTCDTDTYVRERVKGILTEKEIDGDSYGVPSIEDIVDSLCKIIENKEMKEEPNPNYKNAPVNIFYGHGKDFIEVRDGIDGNLAEGFIKGVFEIIELKKEIEKLKQQLNLQGVALTNTAEILEMQTKTKEEIDKNTIWKKTTPEEYERDFINLSKEFIELKEQNAKLQEMFDMQVKLVTALELEKIELRNIIESLTKGKLPCDPDHNGECLVCDCWLSDCPLNKNEKNS